jgi:hypothetical protein
VYHLGWKGPSLLKNSFSPIDPINVNE